MEESKIDTEAYNPRDLAIGINRYNFSTQLLIWSGIFFTCFIIAQLLSGVIILMYYKSADISSIAAHPQDMNCLRVAQMLASFFGFLLPAIIFSRMKDGRSFRYAKADNLFHPVLFVVIPLLVLTIYPLINVSFFINKWMPWNNWMQGSQGEYKAIVDALLADKSFGVFMLNFLTIAAVPAICEEWIFRGTLQRLFTEKLNIHLAVFIASLFFSFIHFEFSGFLPRLILGLLLGYVYYYTQSLWASIYVHLVNNGAQVIIMYLNAVGIYKTDIDNPEMPDVWEFIAYSIGFVLLSYAFFYFVRRRKMLTSSDTVDK